jgi:hypothetical protein
MGARRSSTYSTTGPWLACRITVIHAQMSCTCHTLLLAWGNICSSLQEAPWGWPDAVLCRADPPGTISHPPHSKKPMPWPC